MPSFECQNCRNVFEIAQTAIDKYPGWIPRTCLKCRGASANRGVERTKAVRRTKAVKRSPSTNYGATREEGLTTEEVLAKYSEGPSDGVFTDGASHPNPGPGGWGAVYVKANQIADEAYGHEPHTTNNRMELAALLAGCRLVPKGEKATVWTDSQLCVNTITKWAAGWEQNSWKRKSGAIKNLDLVQQLYALCRERPELELRWIPAHSGYRWNEYADALATAYRRNKK